MVKKYALMSPLCIKSHVHAHSRFLFQFRVGVCWPWWRTSGVQEWIPQVEGSLSWISLARSMDSLYSAIKGSLELDILMLTHTHTVMHTCTHLSTRETHSHTGLFYSEHRHPCSICFLSLPSLLTSVSFNSFLKKKKIYIFFCVSGQVVDFSVSVCRSTCLGLCMSFAQLLIAWLSPSLCLLAIYLPLNVLNFGH